MLFHHDTITLLNYRTNDFFSLSHIEEYKIGQHTNLFEQILLFQLFFYFYFFLNPFSIIIKNDKY